MKAERGALDSGYDSLSTHIVQKPAGIMSRAEDKLAKIFHFVFQMVLGCCEGRVVRGVMLRTVEFVGHNVFMIANGVTTNTALVLCNIHGDPRSLFVLAGGDNTCGIDINHVVAKKLSQ